MRRLLLWFAFAAACAAPALAQDKRGTGGPSAADSGGPAYRLFVEDGQVASHGFLVFVAPDLPADADPMLVLNRHHAVTTTTAEELDSWRPKVVARDQTRVVTEGGVAIARTGTLLVFDVPRGWFDIEIGGHATPLARGSVRALPILSWAQGTASRSVVAPGDVYLTNITWVWVWTLCALLVLVGAVVALSWRGRRCAIDLLLAPDGKLSLSNVQAAVWTLAIGAVVLSYGLARAVIPTVPGSLVALMGLSFATNGLARVRGGAPAAAAPKPRDAWSISDVLVERKGGADSGAVTIERAQMLFWTLALAGLFVAKSILEGTMWDVPWELVALTGFSQGAYLSAKEKPAGPAAADGAKGGAGAGTSGPVTPPGGGGASVPATDKPADVGAGGGAAAPGK